jgi:hypothetical protein
VAAHEDLQVTQALGSLVARETVECWHPYLACDNHTTTIAFYQHLSVPPKFSKPPTPTNKASLTSPVVLATALGHRPRVYSRHSRLASLTSTLSRDHEHTTITTGFHQALQGVFDHTQTRGYCTYPAVTLFWSCFLSGISVFGSLAFALDLRFGFVCLRDHSPVSLSGTGMRTGQGSGFKPED